MGKFANKVRKSLKKSKPPELWVRIGDGGEYENHGDDFDSVATALSEAGVAGDDEIIKRRGGIETPVFCNNNYISLYWGDHESDHVSDLTGREFEHLCRLIQQK